MRHGWTQMSRSGTLPCWSWATIRDTWIDPSSSASGKHWTGQAHNCFFWSLMILMTLHAYVIEMSVAFCKWTSLGFREIKRNTCACLSNRYMVKHKSHLRFWDFCLVTCQDCQDPRSKNLPKMDYSLLFLSVPLKALWISVCYTWFLYDLLDLIPID